MRHPVKPGGRVVCLGQRWLQYYHLSYVVFLLKQVWLYETHEVVTEEEEGFPAFFLVFTLHCLLGLARHGSAGLARRSSLGGHSKLPVHRVS